MSTIIRTVLEGEETSKTEAMMQTLRQSLHLERQRQERQRRLVMQHAALAGSHRAGDRRDARSGDLHSDGARDTDMARPVVQVVGRANNTQPMRPSARSAKSTIVPEPDQIQSKRPNPLPVTGPFEPRG